MTNPARRSPLTGQFRVEFVDMAPSSDGSLPAEFGVVEHDVSLEWLADPRLPEFLRWFADIIEADQRPERDVEFPEPWDDLRNAEDGTLDKRQAIEGQLQRELHQDHDLFGQGVEAIAACLHCDDALFRSQDDGYAIVRLVWSGKGPQVPPRPQTTIHQSWVSAARYLREHDPR